MSLENFEPSFLKLDDRGDVVVAGVNRTHLGDEENIEQLGRELISLIEQYERDRIVLDLDGVQYVTSSVVGKIIALHRRMHRDGGKLVLCGIAGDVENVLATASLLQYFNVVPDVEAAVALIRED